MGDGGLHHARRLHHLRQEHLAGAEQVADDVHAGHQRALDHVQRTAALGEDGLVGLFGVLGDEVGDALHQRVRETLLHRADAPGQARGIVAHRALDGLGGVQQPLGRRLLRVAGALRAVQLRLAVEDDVFHQLAQLGVEVVVHAHHAGVDDAHVHAGLDRVIQEHGVDGFPHRLVAAEREAHVGDAARHLGSRQVLLDPARGVDEIDGVVVVLLDARRDREDVRVEDDVLGRKADLVDQDAVGARADLGLALEGVGLALLVEGHDDRGRAIAAHQAGLAAELVLAFLHRDRVDDALALQAFEACLDHAPLRRVHHHRDARDLGLAGHEVQEAHHRRLAVQHRLVHVDVDDLRAVLDLLPGHGQRLLELAGQDQAGKGLRSGDVGALADVHEQVPGGQRHGLQPGELHRRRILDGGVGRGIFRRRHGPNCRCPCSSAAFAWPIWLF